MARKGEHSRKDQLSVLRKARVPSDKDVNRAAALGRADQGMGSGGKEGGTKSSGGKGGAHHGGARGGNKSGGGSRGMR